jgi:hypothetical protein
MFRNLKLTPKNLTNTKFVFKKKMQQAKSNAFSVYEQEYALIDRKYGLKNLDDTIRKLSLQTPKLQHSQANKIG